MSNFVRNIGIGTPGTAGYTEKEIKVNSDHVDLSTYDPSTTASDSLTKKIHDLEEATPDVATASTAGIVKPGAGLQMHPGSSDGTLDLAYDHTLTLQKEDGTTLGTYDGSADTTITVSTIPINHASVNNTYGVGDSSKYGHLKIVDTYKTVPASPTGVSLSAKGANDMYKEIGFTEVTQAQYDALTPAQKAAGNYYITDATYDPGVRIFTQTLVAGNTQVVFSDPFITANSLIDVYTDTFGVDPTNMTPGTGSVTIDFPEQASNVVVKIEVKEV